MKIKYYGTGTSGAIPEMFCSCRVCEYARSHGGKESVCDIDTDDIHSFRSRLQYAFTKDSSKVNAFQEHSHVLCADGYHHTLL